MLKQATTYAVYDRLHAKVINIDGKTQRNAAFEVFEQII
jgi:hypothetical protein